jgi:hypothetical protein
MPGTGQRRKDNFINLSPPLFFPKTLTMDILEDSLELAYGHLRLVSCRYYLWNMRFGLLLSLGRSPQLL